jgi:hypothetical protein
MRGKAAYKAYNLEGPVYKAYNLELRAPGLQSRGRFKCNSHFFRIKQQWELIIEPNTANFMFEMRIHILSCSSIAPYVNKACLEQHVKHML